MQRDNLIEEVTTPVPQQEGRDGAQTNNDVQSTSPDSSCTSR